MLSIQGDLTTIRGHNASDLVNKYGSPLYVYDEKTLRQRCRNIKNICSLDNFNIYYSTKANASLALLSIILSEGIKADAMSLGELYIVEQAGFLPHEIVFMGNNLKKSELAAVTSKNIQICVDSIDQLKFFFEIAPPGSEVFLRINNGISDGHSKNVQTGGVVKFGITVDKIDEAFGIAKANNGKITGLFSHIGSFFLDHQLFQENVNNLLSICQDYPTIKHIDFGGGFGIPYQIEIQKPFDFIGYSKILDASLVKWQTKTGIKANFSIQPGRYIVGECGLCLCTVQSIKHNFGKKFVGTDLGFNLFPRPLIYGNYHTVINACRSLNQVELCDVAGNLCESGDIQAKNTKLDKKTQIGDVLIFKDAGAYCFSMSSNYTAITKPAEILIREDRSILTIREAEPIEILTKFQKKYK